MDVILGGMVTLVRDEQNENVLSGMLLIVVGMFTLCNA
jgi:hypothetical protein